MHAIRLREFGPPENLILEEMDDPHSPEGQVRIAVSAAGVHLVDTTLHRGNQRGPFPPLPLPTAPGREVAGVVDRFPLARAADAHRAIEERRSVGKVVLVL